MSGVAIEVVETGLSEALLRIEGLNNAPTDELMDGIGRLVQEQTRRRIASEKTSPEGAAWKPNWKGTSILYASGTLHNAIDYQASSDQVEVGAGGKPYFRIHQEGGTIVPKSARALFFPGGNHLIQKAKVTIPQRKYLGLSAANQVEIVHAAEEWVGRLLQ